MVLLVILVAAGFFYYQRIIKPAVTLDNKGMVGIEGTGKFDVEEIPVPSTNNISSIQPPNLDRPIDLSKSNMTADLQAVAKKRITELTSSLKNDPTSTDVWLSLAIYRKMINDFAAAEEIWVYLTKVQPGNFIPFNNLGDLYANYVKNTTKAEANYLQAIKLDPSQIFVYRNLYELYRYILKDDTKAKAILQQGIDRNPNTSKDLKFLLENY